MDIYEIGRFINPVQKHETIVAYIIAQEEEVATARMRAYLQDVFKV